MPVHNADIAAVFGEIADRLDIEGANPFGVRACRNAARVVGDLGRSMRTMIEQGARAEAMAAAAREQGLSYRAITDHSRRLALAHGLDAPRPSLDDAACQMAKAEGVLASIDSDAHSVPDFDDLHHGIGRARRGWLGRADVLNTLTLAALRPLFARTM